jgi:hypothetical protein
MDLCIECQANQASATNDECKLTLLTYHIASYRSLTPPSHPRRHGRVGSMQREYLCWLDELLSFDC